VYTVVRRFFSHLPSIPTQLLDQAFAPLFGRGGIPEPKHMGLTLRKEILKYELQTAHRHKAIIEKSHLGALIRAIPSTLAWEEKLQRTKALLEGGAMPVLTPHPTRVISNDKTRELRTLIESFAKLSKQASPEEEAELITSVRQWAEGRLVPNKSMTPQDESDFFRFLNLQIQDSFPKFHSDVTSLFVEAHGGSRTTVATHLKEPAMTSFKQVLDWDADRDGNKNRTAKTMQETVPAQQKAILALYTLRLERILQKVDKETAPEAVRTLRSIHAFFGRCEESINDDIWFDVKGSNKNKAHTMKRLEDVAEALRRHENATQHTIADDVLALRDLVDLAGYHGGLKHYARQTTQLYQRVLDDLLSVLKKHNPALRKAGRYQDLSLEEKQAFLHKLDSHSRYFKTLKDNQTHFNPETSTELECLAFYLKHIDLYPHIIFSDTKSKLNLDELRVLFGLAACLNGDLRIGQTKFYPANPMILCESPEDIQNFKATLDEILADPLIQNKIAESYFFSYVGGPSDLGKTGGILTYITLLETFLEAEKQFEFEPQLLHILKGFGGDLYRKLGSAFNEKHSTHQGWDAYVNLGAPGAYRAYLHNVLGRASESELRAKEIDRLKTENPEAYDALKELEAACIKAYEIHINAPGTNALLAALSSPNMEKAANISSRAGTKKTIRAIGWNSLYALARNWSHVFMGLEGLVYVPRHKNQHLPTLLNELTAVKDIVYKCLFAIAISDFKRGEIRVHSCGKDINQAHTDIKHTANILLKIIPVFYEGKIREEAHTYLLNHGHLQPNRVALGLMRILGDETRALARETEEHLHYHRLLENCVDAYEANPTAQTLENAVLALRALPVVTGPEFFINLRSPLSKVKLDEASEVKSFAP